MGHLARQFDQVDAQFLTCHHDALQLFLGQVQQVAFEYRAETGQEGGYI